MKASPIFKNPESTANPLEKSIVYEFPIFVKILISNFKIFPKSFHTSGRRNP